MACTAFFFLTKDEILRDYVLSECDYLRGDIDSPSSLSVQDACIVDADSFPPPFPTSCCLVISRHRIDTDLPVLSRPFLPEHIDALLHGDSKQKFSLRDDARALLTEKGTVVFPPLEFSLLSTLFKAKGEVVSRKTLCHILKTGTQASSSAKDPDATLTVYIYRIRKKIAPLGLILQSHHQNGYSLHIPSCKAT